MRTRLLVTAGLVLSLALVGCSDDGDENADPADNLPRATTTTERTTTTQRTTTTPVPTLPPTTAPPPTPPPTVAPELRPPPAPENCTPGYSPCVAVASDVDCAGGSGDGPVYVSGPVTVTGSDPYGLDSDGDGVACES